ncbi:MAG TPA: outer membrane beta-barrel protein [Niastella sp.]
MSDHEFEKQVHLKMEELKLRPSDTVWMEVEKKIRQDKHRRRFLWLWVPMLFICLSTSAYILYRYSFNNQGTSLIARDTSRTAATATTQSANNTQTQNNKQNAADYKNNSTPTINDPQPTNDQQPGTIPPAAPAAGTAPVTGSADNNKQPVVIVKETETGSTSNQPVQKQLVFKSNNNIPVEGMNTITRSGHEKPRYRKKKTATDGFPLRSNDNLVQQEPAASYSEVQAKQESWSATRFTLVNDVNNDIATSKAASLPFSNQSLHLLPDSLSAGKPAALPIPRSRPSLWFWGITADAGFSRISENKLFQLKGLLGQDKYLAEDLSARSSSPVASTNSLINYAGASASTTAKVASPIQPDLAFSAGFFIQRKLSPRLKISLGLEYTYMSVNTEIGQKIKDSTVVNMGRSSAAVVPYYYKGAVHPDAQSGINRDVRDSLAMFNQRYRYRFQYIEVPLLVNWQINKGRKLPPVVFEGGVSISHLLSVDALHYEGIKGIYYQDNSLFNKTSFNFIAGVNVGLLQQSKHPIWIGPDLRYSLNGLVKKDVSTGQYLWSAGIKVKMILGKL